MAPHLTHSGLTPRVIVSSTSFVEGVSGTGGLPPDDHAARTKRAAVTTAPIKGVRMSMIDQVSISILMNASQSESTDLMEICDCRRNTGPCPSEKTDELAWGERPASRTLSWCKQAL